MATQKKKTNYASYELANLEKYLQQLQNYLDKNAPDTFEDRIERIPTKYGTTIRVISSIEQQLKAFTDTLQKLPAIVAEVNSLRKSLNEEKVDKEVRGNEDIPGFMEDATEEDDDALPKSANTDIDDIEQIIETKSRPQLPVSTTEWGHLYNEEPDDFEE